MNKTLPFLLLFVLCTLVAPAQQAFLSPDVLASAGSTSAANGASISFTLGETAVQTLAANGISYGQGFHNGVLFLTKVEDLELSDWRLKVFPNPASQTVNVSYTAPNGVETLSATLWDMQGRQLMEATPLLPSDKNAVTVQQLPSGVYLLRLADELGRIATVRIVKAD